MGVYSQALPVQLIRTDSSILGTIISELPQYPAPSLRYRCILIIFESSQVGPKPGTQHLRFITIGLLAINIARCVG